MGEQISPSMQSPAKRIGVVENLLLAENNCDTAECSRGYNCEYLEGMCIPDKLCFAEVVCMEEERSGKNLHNVTNIVIGTLNM